jgi:radical SAM protein with 4Fe4S-binding SPASM domain
MSDALVSSYADAPRVVIWEMTRACALACRHCRAEAIPRRNPAELTTSEAFALVDAVSECGKPIFVLTGGDPFMRDDLCKIVEYAVNSGLRTAVSPSATGRLTPASLQGLSRAGCHRISLSIDAASAEQHDAFRGVRGSFARTIDAIRAARECGIEVQISTTISRFNYMQLEDLATLMSTLDIALWSVFFLVPVGRAQIEDVLSPDETEAAFAELYRVSDGLPFHVKTTEAPHYRRYLLQHPREGANVPPYLSTVGDGKGFVFISNRGEIFPSGFLPVVTGNVRTERLIEVYRDNPLMQRLRDPDTFVGKCGVCEFRRICGGSRSRAYAMTGDPFASEPTCAYLSPSWAGKATA